MNVKILTDKNCRKITALIYGDLDHHTAKHIRSDIDSAIHENNPKRLIIDFSNVTFMDSSGIGLVMGRYKIMNEMSGEVLIANPPTYIRKVIQLAGLHKLCPIVTNSEDKPIVKPISENNSDNDLAQQKKTTISEGQNA
ncbi:MAG: anti-sigma factor antagonist [Ruminococcus sp.]|nr:anti-sigma factor antagonist [Ruminococcus sp.]